MSGPPLRVVRSRRRERPADPDVVRQLERVVIGSLISDPARIPFVAEVVSERDFADPRLGLVFERWGAMYREGAPMTLPVLSDELDQRDELDRIGGNGELAAISDEADSGMGAVEHARRVRRHALERRAALLHERASDGIRDPGDLDELVRIDAEITGLEAPPAAAVEGIGFSGDELRSIVARDEPPSPLPGLLDPYPSLHLLVGRPKVGKTTFALHLAQSWACGVAPWTGAPALPGTRALVISAEQSACRVATTLRRLAEWHGEDPRDHWPDQVRVVARDRALSRESASLLKLDPRGLAVLRWMLQSGADAGNPFGLVLLDSLSRLKPPEAEENNADHLTAFLDPLAAIATDLCTYMLLIHHQGHEDRANPVTAPRGSTSIAAVAQAVWKLDPVDGLAWQRRVTVSGNAIDHDSLTFQVAPESEPGKVLYFHPADPCAAYDLDELIPVGDALSEHRIAQKISGKDKPSGAANRRATALVAAWERQGKVHRDPPIKRGQPGLIRRVGT